MNCKGHNWIKVYDRDYSELGEAKVELPDHVTRLFTCDRCGKWKVE